MAPVRASCPQMRGAAGGFLKQPLGAVESIGRRPTPLPPVPTAGTMTQTLQVEHPPDICLMLRVHGEQRWLVSKVIPALRQLEEQATTEPDELAPAVAYLEVLWLEAGLRAAETDAAAAKLRPPASRPTVLEEKAERYAAAVRRLRQAVDKRVRELTVPSQETAGA